MGSLSNDDLYIYQFALNQPTKNIIANNTVSCNTTNNPDCPRGFGIYGSSIQNLIMENVSYNHPFNYVNVTTVFSQLLYGNFIPSPLQNIAVNGCQPICQPCNLATASMVQANQIACLETLVRQLVANAGLVAAC